MSSTWWNDKGLGWGEKLMQFQGDVKKVAGGGGGGGYGAQFSLRRLTSYIQFCNIHFPETPSQFFFGGRGFGREFGEGVDGAQLSLRRLNSYKQFSLL